MRRKVTTYKNLSPDTRYNGNGISLAEYKSIGGNGSASFSECKLRLPLPNSKEELDILTEYVFGIPIHLKELHSFSESASYEVLEDHDGYYDHKFTYAAHNSSYDVDAMFWKTVIGAMSCGGIARASYGSVKVNGHRNKKRVARLASSIGSKRSSSVRRPFARLAERIRVRREQNDSR